MTVAEFFGCAFLAFGPPLAMFMFTIAHDPIRIIILIAAAFFWLLSLLISSLLWLAVVPLRDFLAFGVVFSVAFQEVFRWFVYKLLRKTERGLQEVAENERVTENKHILAYVSGLGFGIISGTFALVNVLADMSVCAGTLVSGCLLGFTVLSCISILHGKTSESLVFVVALQQKIQGFWDFSVPNGYDGEAVLNVGPGTMGLESGSEIFFITSAAQTLCIILLHTFWSVIFFHALDTSKYTHVAYVVLSHLLVSCLTLLNKNELYAATLTSSYIITLFSGIFAFQVAGGSFLSFKRFITCK